MALIAANTPFLLDGNPILDAHGRTMLLSDFDEQLEQNWSMQQFLDGSIGQTFHGTTREGRTGPAGLYRHTWSSSGLLDETAFRTLKGLAGAPYLHNLAIKIPNYEWFHTSDSPNRDEFYLYREILGNAYGPVEEMGVNAGTGPSFVSEMTVYNRLTAGSWAYGTGLIFGRNYDIVDNGSLASGDKVTLTVTTPDGTSTPYDFVTPADWAIGGDADATANNIAVAIATDLAITGVTAWSGASSSAVLIWKVDSDVNVLDLTTTLAVPAAIDIHPDSGEVSLDRFGPYAFRNIKMGVAPAAGLGVVKVEAHFLYNVLVSLSRLGFKAGTTADGYIPTTITFKEMGSPTDPA